MEGTGNLISSLPFQGYETAVQDVWLDVNDHMNARFYGDVIYAAHALLTERIGLGDDYVARTGNGKMVVESHMMYEREVRAGAQLGVRSWLLNVDDKRLHFAHELLNLSEGVRAAFCEQMDLHVDLDARRVAPMPGAVQEHLQALAGTVSRDAVARLPLGKAVRQL